MGIGVSTLLIAAGAIMAFAIDVESSGGININTVGIILMVVGFLGLVVTMTVFGPRRRGVVDDVVEGDTVVETRRRQIV
jgi:hypothetical protein